MGTSANALRGETTSTGGALGWGGGAGLPRGRLLQQRADVPVLVTRVEPGGGLVLAVAGDVRIGAEERIAFDHRGKHPGPVRALVDVVSVQRNGNAARVTVRCRALHSTAGVATLRSFVQETLRLAPVDAPAAYPSGAGGHYYQVAEHHAPPAAGGRDNAVPPKGVTADP